MAPKRIRTMEEFAEFVGLSRPTVSKFFHDPLSVRATTRRRIEGALAVSNFRPNLFAVNLNRQQAKIIGLIVPDRVDPFYMGLTRQIEERAASAGYLAFTLSSDGRPEREEEAIRTFASLNVSGAIIVPLGPTSHAKTIRSLGETIPLVFVDSRLDSEGPFVGTDNYNSVLIITDYLTRSGSAPTYFGMPEVNTNAAERRQAYISAMEKLRRKPQIARLTPKHTWNFEQYAFDEALRIFRSGGFATNTVLCANDRVAYGVLAAAYHMQLRVGIGAEYDLRVAGHDNHPLSAFSCPPLTTVAQNDREIAATATDLLFRNIEVAKTDASKIARDCVLLGAELKMRASA